MNRLLCSAALGFALALAGCATSPATHQAEGKALTETAIALDGVNRSLTTLAQTGVLKGPAAQRAKDLDTQAKASQDAALAAYRAGKDADAVTNSTLVSTLLAQLITIISGAK